MFSALFNCLQKWMKTIAIHIICIGQSDILCYLWNLIWLFKFCSFSSTLYIPVVKQKRLKLFIIKTFILLSLSTYCKRDKKNPTNWVSEPHGLLNFWCFKAGWICESDFGSIDRVPSLLWRLSTCICLLFVFYRKKITEKAVNNISVTLILFSPFNVTWIDVIMMLCHLDGKTHAVFTNWWMCTIKLFTFMKKDDMNNFNWKRIQFLSAEFEEFNHMLASC